jgi:hypothetical protein
LPRSAPPESFFGFAGVLLDPIAPFSAALFWTRHHLVFRRRVRLVGGLVVSWQFLWFSLGLHTLLATCGNVRLVGPFWFPIEAGLVGLGWGVPPVGLGCSPRSTVSSLDVISWCSLEVLCDAGVRIQGVRSGVLRFPLSRVFAGLAVLCGGLGGAAGILKHVIVRLASRPGGLLCCAVCVWCAVHNCTWIGADLPVWPRFRPASWLVGRPRSYLGIVVEAAKYCAGLPPLLDCMSCAAGAVCGAGC